MSIFSRIFGTGGFQNDPIPHLQSILPTAAATKIQGGSLPVLKSDKLILKKGEDCHYVDVGAVITDRKHYQSGRRGASVRVAKGWTVHSGSVTSVPVTTYEVTKGILFITNKRIVFVAQKHGFSQKISSLTAMTLYDDGLVLQINGTAQRIVLPSAFIAKKVIELLT